MKHGTTNGYGNFGCRCRPCKDAQAEYQRRRRLERASIEPPADAHGKPNTYTNWGCTCAPCVIASAEKRIAYEQRRIAAAREQAAS